MADVLVVAVVVVFVDVAGLGANRALILLQWPAISRNLHIASQPESSSAAAPYQREAREQDQAKTEQGHGKTEQDHPQTTQHQEKTGQDHRKTKHDQGETKQDQVKSRQDQGKTKQVPREK